MSATVLVTGGLGYIGAHTCVALAEAGRDVVVVDNLANSSSAVLDRIAGLTGRAPAFVHGDIRDVGLLAATMREHEVGSVIHFAGSKAVGESVGRPLSYYDNNVGGSMALLAAMAATGVRTLIFSSSATVYAQSGRMPLAESAALGASSPYGRSKLFVEHMLADLCGSDPAWAVACLRYFNPVGAHPSARIGESPRGVPNNLMPYIAQVAVGQRERLSVFGADYDTPDGTGVRDYVHVLDVAEGHVKALDYLQRTGGHAAINLGTGRGVSVLEMLREYERASGRTIAFQVAPRRAGDVAQCWAEVELARSLLGWQARRSLAQMCEDSWRWQRDNPQGYR
ncbi:UDP-glucose 4-epimerase [Lysobacter enzymogenes]|uniref:UDP-glucose 4-epimerase n=1 Tax=Lysobacter enzymogenes TaxID=69 RepID=A0A0S2DL99_LYSEN|nr:UDP-glucose 4-epimerase GalE [Lysobacter enzymogenes]ALN59217.1 UDP-glucose 4-epimerase [Lysobacter enzymogenes]QCW27420.1 UDP-glucose 4-epimerase GalE [Lysobacter enzymogenes]